MNPLISLILLLLAVAMSAVAIGAAIFFLQRYNNPEPSLLQVRLDRIKSRGAEEASMELDEQALKLSRLYKEADYQNMQLGRKLEAFPIFMQLKINLQQAGMKVPADKFFMSNMVIPAAMFTVLGLVSRFLPLALLGLVIPAGAFMYVVMQKKKRMARFVTLMPDALSMITSALRAGHSFQSALTVVSTELPDPISTEFSSMVRDINLGIPVKDALGRMALKLDNLPDVRMFATAVLIQREAGGNLAEVLEKLGYTIRERFKLKGQISALTGQSRLTGYVLGGAPAFILVGLSVFMYGYVKPLWETDMGHLALGAVVVLQSIGFFVMKKIIDIRV